MIPVDPTVKSRSRSMIPACPLVTYLLFSYSSARILSSKAREAGITMPKLEYPKPRRDETCVEELHGRKVSVAFCLTVLSPAAFGFGV